VPNAIAFRDPSNGLLGTGRNGQGTISLTTDGGRTWKVALRTPRPVVWVGPYRNGLGARLDDGENLESTDGGRTWSPSSNAGGGSFFVFCPQGLVQMPSTNAEWAIGTNQTSAGN